MAEEQEELNLGSTDDLDVIEVPDNLVETLTAEVPESEEKPEEKPEETSEQRRDKKRNDSQKRINELVRKAHEADEARAAAEAKAELLEQRLREREEREHASTQESLKRREQELIEKRRKAEEDGDMTAYSPIQDELTDVRIKMATVKPERQPEKPPERKPEQAPRMVPAAEAWLHANPWFASEENGELANEVVRIQNELAGTYSLNDPKQAFRLYQELDKRISAKPEFRDVLGIEEEQEEAQQEVRKPAPRSHIAPPSRGGEAPPKPKGGGLTPHDIRAMKTVGLDPNDPKAREAYLKRKR